MITFVQHSSTSREVQCRCAKCSNLCDGIFQHLDGAAWAPSPNQTLGILGWVVDSEKWFCSKYCRDVYVHMMTRDEPIKAVTKLSVPLGPAQRAYAAK